MTGAQRIAAERKRQIEVEGWTPEHDDNHADDSLSIAAACYAVAGLNPPVEVQCCIDEEGCGTDAWPWSHDDGKRDKHPRIRRLEIAGALIAAEIDRELRLAGVCRVCGCTEDSPCPGGCAWADKERTICTTCQDKAAGRRPQKERDSHGETKEGEDTAAEA